MSVLSECRHSAAKARESKFWTIPVKVKDFFVVQEDGQKENMLGQTILSTDIIVQQFSSQISDNICHF